MNYDLTHTIPYWEKKANTWDEAMADGSPFQQILVEPHTLQFLNLTAGQTVLDIACGNGQMSRRLARLGASVTAFDGSQEMINLAKQRSEDLGIDYRTVDVTKAENLEFLSSSQFDAIICNMALMDIEDIKPVFQLAYKVLKETAVFVFSITHPCFDKSVGPHIREMQENEGTLVIERSIKVQQYLEPNVMKTRALPSLPSPHYFFHRPLQSYLKTAFEAGFVMCDVAEPAFPQESTLTEHKGWHELFHIPVVFIAKFKKN